MLPRRNWMSFAITLVLSSLFVLTGCGDKAPPVQGPPEVGVYTAVVQPISITLDLAGRTRAYAVAEVRPQVGGLVLKRHFTEGADVKAGQQLYQIDPAMYRATYESAKAALAKTQANAMATQSRAERYKDLVAVQAVSKQEYDDALATMKQNAADVLSSKAALKMAHINLSYTQVNSPIAGRIGRSTVTQGALVTAGQATPLATVQQLDPMYVEVNQASTEYLRLRHELENGHLQTAGADAAKVKLTMEDGTEYPFEGILQLSDINVDPSTSAVTLRAIFPNPKGLLLPGVFVRATLEAGINNQAILLPQQAVMRNPKGEPFVYIVEKDNKVALRQLTLGQAIGNQWVVFKGIQAGEQVIVEGLQQVQPGLMVKTVKVSAPSEARVTENSPPSASTATASVTAIKSTGSTNASAIAGSQSAVARPEQTKH